MANSTKSLEKLKNLEILIKLEKMISIKELEAFKVVRGQTIPTKNLQEGRVYILQDPTTQKQYIFRTNSSGGIFTEYGDQTIYQSWSIDGINPACSRDSLSQLVTEYESNISDSMIVSRLSSSHDTHWHAGSGMDYVGGEDSSSERKGDKDELFERILRQN